MFLNLKNGGATGWESRSEGETVYTKKHILSV